MTGPTRELSLTSLWKRLEPAAEERRPPRPRARPAVRMDVYDALVRHLVKPEGTQPIHLLSDACRGPTGSS